MPPETLVCSGHEYTTTNLRFALTIDPDNAALQDRMARVEAARAAGTPTVPSTLQEECDTNPFLRAHLPQVKELSRDGIRAGRSCLRGNQGSQRSVLDLYFSPKTQHAQSSGILMLR